MAASDLVSVRGQVMEYSYIPTGIKGEMVRSGMDCHRKGQVIGTVGRRPVAIRSSGQTISSLAYIEGITLGAGEKLLRYFPFHVAHIIKCILKELQYPFVQSLHLQLDPSPSFCLL